MVILSGNVINSQRKVGWNNILTHVYKDEIQAEGKLYMGCKSEKRVNILWLATTMKDTVPGSL